MDDWGSLAQRALNREPGGVATAISIVEDQRAASERRAHELLRELRTRQVRGRQSHRIGITGPPGVGKSTLTSRLALAARASGKSVGVLAIDPSSVRSGGALLGDRARMRTDPADTDVFIRSMASGGDLGGLARAAGAAVDVLSYCFELVLIETTGVGQSETDIEHIADTVVFVVQPASGDALQFMKAGIVEIPHVLVVNKADLGDVAGRAQSELSAALAALHPRQDPSPVLLVSSQSGRGVAELMSALDDRYQRIRAELPALRQQHAVTWATQLFRKRYGDVGMTRAGGVRAVASELEELIGNGASAIEAVAAAAPSAWR